MARADVVQGLTASLHTLVFAFVRDGGMETPSMAS